jgi:hypothetical protein
MIGLLAAGCGFEVASKGSRIDAAFDALDAPGTMTCPWPYTPSGFDPCTGVPTEIIPDLDLDVADTYVYDTSDGSLTPPTGVDLVVPFTDVGGAHVMWTRSFRLGALATLRVIGDDPLVLVSQSGVIIDGTIDVGSHVLGNNTVGAGSDPSACAATVAANGMTCTHGGSGGGGGGFGTAGAPGGAGGGVRNCTGQPAGTGVPGGAGGAATTDKTLRGGCDGGDGAQGDGSQPGAGGKGGGAIHVVARDQLVVAMTGRVLAGGAGGTGGNNGRSGGGGGGSGGLIMLSGTTIRIDTNGVLAANGGGGGGGADGGIGGSGSDGQPSSLVAAGGTAGTGASPGGTGAAAETLAMTGGTVDRGGGGGGGGGGRIQLTVKPGNTPVTTGAVITPPASN